MHTHAHHTVLCCKKLKVVDIEPKAGSLTVEPKVSIRLYTINIRKHWDLEISSEDFVFTKEEKKCSYDPAPNLGSSIHWISSPLPYHLVYPASRQVWVIIIYLNF